MRSVLRQILVGMVLVSGGSALAREVKEFKGLPSSGPKKSKTGSAEVNRWNGNDNIPKEADPPWGFITLSVIILAIAAPFGVRMYRNTAAEVSDGSVPSKRSRAEEEA